MAFHETGSLTFPFFILVYLALTWYMLPWKREELVSIRVLLSVLKKNPPLACGVWQAVTKINKLRTDATFPWGTTLASPLHFCTCEWKITALMSHVPHGKNVWSCWTDESSHKNKTKQNPNKQKKNLHGSWVRGIMDFSLSTVANFRVRSTVHFSFNISYYLLCKTCYLSNKIP